MKNDYIDIYVENLERENYDLLKCLKKILKASNRDDMDTIEAITEAEKLIKKLTLR